MLIVYSVSWSLVKMTPWIKVYRGWRMFPARIFYSFSQVSLMELPMTVCSLPSTLILAALFCGKAAIRLQRYGGCCLLCWTVMSHRFLGCTPLVWILVSDCKACFSSEHWLLLGWSHGMCHLPIFLPCSPLVSWHVNRWEWRCVRWVPDLDGGGTCRVWHTAYIPSFGQQYWQGKTK